jgi:uncharacterized protein (DUF924 family)
VTETLPTPREIIEFWRDAGPKRWFSRDAAFDEEIRRRFLPAHTAAAAGRLKDWEANEDGTLALLLLLDQFSRNMFRNDPRSYATDPLARAVAAAALIKGYDSQFLELRDFFYLPFVHSEDLADQERAIALYQAARSDDFKWAQMHADIIRRFGRYPHRNAVLGRASTPEEQAFLDRGGFAG